MQLQLLGLSIGYNLKYQRYDLPAEEAMATEGWQVACRVGAQILLTGPLSNCRKKTFYIASCNVSGFVENRRR